MYDERLNWNLGCPGEPSVPGLGYHFGHEQASRVRPASKQVYLSINLIRTVPLLQGSWVLGPVWDSCFSW